MTTVSTRSHDIMERARALFPGGVNSPVRAFRGVGGDAAIDERDSQRVQGGLDREGVLI